MMVQAGLYAPGSDPLTDRAIKLFTRLDGFLAGANAKSPMESFARLRKLLEG
jgi:flagellum-specific ATP synthase